jgi:hypothetical protein
MDPDHRWLISYEKSRHREPKELNESWVASKYSSMGNWREVQQIYIPSLKLRVGPAFHKLKKLWAKYKIQGREGLYRTDTAYQINKLLVGLDLPRVDLPELEGIPDYEFKQDQEEDGLIAETPEEWSDLDQQLLKEEKESEAEAEQEANDWWFSEY